jgi:hypothetical protein
MLRIESDCDGEGPCLRLIGRVRSEHLPELKSQIGTVRPAAAMDLTEVTLVDVEVVRFLASLEREGILLRGCPAFIREWICRERDEASNR